MTKANTVPTTSIITLRTYVDLLERVSLGQVRGVWELSGAEERAARELLRAGLVSDNEERLFDGIVVMRDHLAITPNGVAALESWSAHLKKSRPLYRAVDTLLKLLWVIAGAFAASLPDLLKAMLG